MVNLSDIIAGPLNPNAANGFVLLDGSANLIYPATLQSSSNDFNVDQTGNINSMGNMSIGNIQCGPITGFGSNSFDGGAITTSGSGIITTSEYIQANAFSAENGITVNNGGIVIGGASSLDGSQITTDGSGNAIFYGALTAAGGINYPSSTTFVDTMGQVYSASGAKVLDASGLLYPPPLASSPSLIVGALYFDTGVNKLMVGGAAGWETVTSI